MAIVLALVAIAISLGSLYWVRRNVKVTLAKDHRERAPQLRAVYDHRPGSDTVTVFYEVHNDGAEDLDAVLIHAPAAGLRGVYRVAEDPGPWADHASLGALPMGRTRRFQLLVGPVPHPQEFQARVISTRGKEEWTTVLTLEVPAGFSTRY